VARRLAVLCALTIALAGAAVLAAGCGEPDEDTTSGSLFLTVYTAGPLSGDDAAEAQDGADAVKLALEEADGMAGPFTVNVVALDDTDPDTKRWGPDQVVANARRAIADRNIMAYVGDSGSGAMALALPLLNEAGVLAVGPTTGYVGLTRPAGRGEPERFYPSGEVTFGRIAPADDVQADAIVDALRGEDVRRLAVLQDGELDALGLAGLVTRRAKAAGIDVVLERPVDTEPEDQSAIAEDVAEAGADAALFAGTQAGPAARVLDALHRADPALHLVAPSGLADPALAEAITAGTARRLLLTSPAVPLARLPGGGRFAEAFRRAFGREPAPSAIFDFEAMRAILAAVRAAGNRGNDREEVIRAFPRLADRRTALGTISQTATGDSTLRRYGIWRVEDGRLAFVREAASDR
jgi:branched-chain amino acid transport system substrate-binding protein